MNKTCKHKYAFTRKDMPEAKHYKLIKCPVCGFWVRKYDAIDEKEFDKRYQ